MSLTGEKALLGLVNRAREFGLISLPGELARFENSQNLEISASGMQPDEFIPPKSLPNNT